ncbi:MAG: fibronectin type III domain-containing protein [Rhodoglobus sp.]
MTDVGFGGNVGTAWDGSGEWLRSSIGMPSGRAMFNGSGACLVTAVGCYVSGRGATRAIYLQLGSSRSALFNIGAGGHPPAFTGYIGIPGTLVNGGAADIYIIHSKAAVNFGRSSTSGANGVFNSNGYGQSGILGGAYRYAQGPSAPTSVSVVSSVAGQATVSLAGPADNGGATVTSYVIQYSTSATFTGAASVSTTSSPTTITGLTPGLRYYFRVMALNAVTAAAGTWGTPSTAVNTLVLSGAKYGVDGVWKDCEVYYGLNGAWVPVSVSFGEDNQWKAMQ